MTTLWVTCDRCGQYISVQALPVHTESMKCYERAESNEKSYQKGRIQGLAEARDAANELINKAEGALT